MSRKAILCILAATVMVMAFTFGSMACTSIIVGKNASVTGEVLLGHNEDNGGRLVMPVYLVDHQTNAKGELLQLENNTARIPQAAETARYFWTETRAPLPGASFSDFMYNEYGVAVASDSCASSKVDTSIAELVDNGMGYAIRKIIGERAKTAREGVELAAWLVETYGYFASGRSYQICDKNEGWVFQVVMGKTFCAQRVPDDEVMVIPNHYVTRKVDFKDAKNFVTSKNLITYAVEKGWYKPAKEGDYSDFDFAKTYQKETSFRAASNTFRHRYAHKILHGLDIPADAELPFSVKPLKKVGLQDIMNALSYHYEGTPDDLTNGYKDGYLHFTTMRVLCASSTQESYAIQLRNDPNFTVLWRSSGHPCTSPYTPWYGGIMSVPEEYAFIDPALGKATHFAALSDNYSYDPSRAWWAFIDLQTLVNFNYATDGMKVREWKAALQKEWFANQKAFESAVMGVYKADKAKALAMLTEYSSKNALRAMNEARELYNEILRLDVEILSAEIDLAKAEEPVKAVLFGSADVDVSKVDLQTLAIGADYSNPSSWARARETAVSDVNLDGFADITFTVLTKDIRSLTPCYMNLWVSAKYAGGPTLAAQDTVSVVKSF
ncbi:MAG: Dipeptidase A [Firmicutes bacterium ADurb.Bin153]|nr:MAG: Dipeptidase A [Firmicutes bacterium ADurb.Bin153]